MLAAADLSLEQAPPISVPFRFFLTAPLFAMAAAVLILVQGPEVFASRWSPGILATTHLLTLGYMTMVMLGALMQMLPVLAGAPLPAISLVAWSVHLALTGGSVVLAAAFVSDDAELIWGALLVAAAIAVFTIAAAIALSRITLAGSTVRAMVLAMIALIVTIVMGVLLAAGYAGFLSGMNLSNWTGPHLFWGLAGWAAVLVAGVSFRVVPMFQVTPPYPLLLRKGLALLISVCILGWSLSRLLETDQAWVLTLGRGLLVLAVSSILVFAVTTLVLQQKRKRKITDNTLLFWRTGLICILLGGGLVIANQVGWTRVPVIFLGVLIIQGAVISLINGMLYRIVPFLSWFHLQHRQLALANFTVRLPHMKSLVSDGAGKIQFYFHLAALLAALSGATGSDGFIGPAAVMFFISNLLLLINLGGCTLKYHRLAQQLMSSGGGD